MFLVKLQQCFVESLGMRKRPAAIACCLTRPSPSLGRASLACCAAGADCAHAISHRTPSAISQHAISHRCPDHTTAPPRPHPPLPLPLPSPHPLLASAIAPRLTQRAARRTLHAERRCGCTPLAAHNTPHAASREPRAARRTPHISRRSRFLLYRLRLQLLLY
jgi:hypothetical protein